MSKKYTISFDSPPACVPPQAVHGIVSYLYKQWSYEQKTGITRSQPRAHNVIFTTYKLFRLKNRLLTSSPKRNLRAKLNAQYSAKPKNPV